MKMIVSRSEDHETEDHWEELTEGGSKIYNIVKGKKLSSKESHCIEACCSCMI
jgi:hypothetical protein